MNWRRGPFAAATTGWIVLTALAVLVASAGMAWAGRCATGRHSGDRVRVVPPPPLARASAAMAARSAAPVPTDGASVYTTERFRVLWGQDHDAGLRPWKDGDDDGYPDWVVVLAQALEDAYAIQIGLGFPAPYGVDGCAADPVGGCYIDAYVGNTGVVAGGDRITIGSSFYAYTEIDTDYDVAFFVFNFASIRSEAVLRATAAHELFHAVQRAMGYPWNAAGPGDGPEFISEARWQQEGWWLEATATWVEEVTFPEVDDYVTYVADFLATPNRALNSLNGLHEYGAALFAGYLWELYGGAELVRAVYEEAYALQLEDSLRNGLHARGAGALEDVVASFWAQAARPSTSIWPDAQLFRPATHLAAVNDLPVTGYPSATDRPGRFGANLIRLDAGLLPAVAAMNWPVETAAWRLALRDRTGAAVAVVTPDRWTTLTLTGDATDAAYVAVVNVSPLDGSQSYLLEVGGDGSISDAEQWRSASNASTGLLQAPGWDAGGCFLATLSR